jgi:predicted secreted hydrolase
MKIAPLCLLSFALAAGFLQAEQLDQQGWQIAEPNYPFRFPEDHLVHPSYRAEWWYFTGNLQTGNREEFGYQLTFFRFGVRPPVRRVPTRSAFVMDDLKFAHFTVTDVSARQFHAAGATARGAFGEAGFSTGPRLAWINNWEVNYDGDFHLTATRPEYAIELILHPVREPVLQGINGFSRKATEEGHASEYYSITRLDTSGSVRIGDKRWTVNGISWFDREWATNQLTTEQTGWDWFSLQLSNGTDLMLYQMRNRSGQIDPTSNGTVVHPDGTQVYLKREDFQLEPTAFWTSPVSQARYPIGWRLRVDKLKLELDVSTPVPNQELSVGVRYWEGCIGANGHLGEQSVSGKGYLELTGYEGAVPGLSAQKK